MNKPSIRLIFFLAVLGMSARCDPDNSTPLKPPASVRETQETEFGFETPKSWKVIEHFTNYYDGGAGQSYQGAFLALFSTPAGESSSILALRPVWSKSPTWKFGKLPGEMVLDIEAVFTRFDKNSIEVGRLYGNKQVYYFWENSNGSVRGMIFDKTGKKVLLFGYDT